MTALLLYLTRTKPSRREPSYGVHRSRSGRKRFKRLFCQEGQGVALVYGRRRVGKSELIKQCMRENDTHGIYYECKQTSEANNVESLATLASECLGYPPLAFSGIEDMLKFVFEQAKERNLVLVLDEYP